MAGQGHDVSQVLPTSLSEFALRLPVGSGSATLFCFEQRLRRGEQG